MSFLVPEGFISVECEFIDLGNGNIFIINDDSTREKCKKKGRKITKIKANFRRPTWGSYNRYTKGTIKENLYNNESYVDAALLEQQRFMALLEEIYEIQDGKENKITLTQELFEKINYEIVLKLMRSLDLVIQKEKIKAMKELDILNDDEDDENKEDKTKDEDEN